MDDPTHRFIYEFGEFLLDARRGVLRSRREGPPIDLTPKALGILTYLVEHAGETVPKGILLASVWPGVIVEEGNLTQTIHVLRKVLGEHPEDHRYIVTVPGRGYRFVADVLLREDTVGIPPIAPTAPTAATVQPTSQPRGQMWRRLVIATLAFGVFAAAYFVLRPQGALPGPAADRARSIAVLPFTDLSPSHDSRWFADGLAEEVLNLLTATPDLRVIARTSSFSLGGGELDVATIAQRLDVGHVLEGSVRRAGGRVRITAQLIDASDSSHVWSATYDRNLDDVFAVQSEIAAAVVNALQSEMRGLAPRRGSVVQESGLAWEHFLRGRYFYNRRAPGDLERARAAYEQALAADARFARAWAGLAAVYSIQTGDGVIPRDIGLPRLLDAAQKAIQYDPRLTEGHIRLGNYYRLTGQRERAREHFREAAAMDPHDVLVIGGEAGSAAAAGRYAEAVARQREAVSIDPLSVTVVGNLGAYLFAAGQFEEAKAAHLRALDLGGGPQHVADVGRILVLQKQYAEALAFAERAPAGEERDHVLALAAYSLGRTAQADAALARLTSAGSKDPFAAAEVYAWRGEADAAFRWLARATTPGEFPGSFPAARMAWDMKASPLLASLHGDPRWAAWVAATGN